MEESVDNRLKHMQKVIGVHVEDYQKAIRILSLNKNGSLMMSLVKHP